MEIKSGKKKKKKKKHDSNIDNKSRKNQEIREIKTPKIPQREIQKATVKVEGTANGWAAETEFAKASEKARYWVQKMAPRRAPGWAALRAVGRVL